MCTLLGTAACAVLGAGLQKGCKPETAFKTEAIYQARGHIRVTALEIHHSASVKQYLQCTCTGIITYAYTLCAHMKL